MRYYTEQEIKILQQEYPSLDKKSLLLLLKGRSWPSIKDKAKKLGLSRPNIREAKLKILLENNLINAYWWGFIMADGHLSKKGSLIVGLHKKDSEHLNKLALLISGSIHAPKSSPNMRVLSVMDRINGLRLKNKLGIIEKKTYNPPLSFDFLKSPEEMLAFYIGVTDGDGNITFNKKQIFKSVRIVIHGNWCIFYKNFCEKLSEYFPNLTFTVNNTNARKNTTIYLGKKSNYQFLLNFIKNNNISVLTRKWRNKTIN